MVGCTKVSDIYYNVLLSFCCQASAMSVGERRNGNLLVQLDPKLQAQPVELLRQRLSPDGHTEYLIRWALQNVEEAAGSGGATLQTESKTPNILMWMSAEEVYTNCPTLLGKRKSEGQGIAEEKTPGSPDEAALQEMTEDVRMLVQRATRQMSQSSGPDSSILNTIHVLSAYASIGSLAGVFKETGALDLLMKMLCNSEKQIRKNAGKMLRALASHDAGGTSLLYLLPFHFNIKKKEKSISCQKWWRLHLPIQLYTLCALLSTRYPAYLFVAGHIPLCVSSTGGLLYSFSSTTLLLIIHHLPLSALLLTTALHTPPTPLQCTLLLCHPVLSLQYTDFWVMVYTGAVVTSTYITPEQTHTGHSVAEHRTHKCTLTDTGGTHKYRAQSQNTLRCITQGTHEHDTLMCKTQGSHGHGTLGCLTQGMAHTVA